MVNHSLHLPSKKPPPPVSRGDDVFLLKDVVERAGLDRRTARYVLDKAIGLDIRGAEGRGHHRRFSIVEALRLAVCTRLVMLGVPVDQATKATVWCENRAQSFDKPCVVLANPPYASDPANHWYVEIVKTKYLQLWREKPDWLNAKLCRVDPDDYLEMGSGNILTGVPCPKHHIKTGWNMTELALIMFWGETGIRK